jgi:Rrf2 family transcriptional regulator, iron-sulfur cluster assembly transcription factor
MILSKSSEYGVRAAIYIAQQSLNDQRPSLKDIAREIDSPEAFTAKILQKLVRGGVISSVKGATGGFEVDKKQLRRTKLIDLVRAIDGDAREQTCVLGLKACSEAHPCPVHHQFRHIKKEIVQMLQRTGLEEMSASINEGLSCLKIG